MFDLHDAALYELEQARKQLKAADELAKAARYCKDHECKPWPCKAMNDALVSYEKVRGVK